MQRRHFVTLSCAALAAPALHAQGTWPSQQIRWIVPYPAGGGTDVLARVISEAMRPALNNVVFVIENRPGAATNIAGETVARAKPDGYTVMSADNAILAYNEHLFSKLPFDPKTDFTYIGGFSRFPLALVVNPQFPAKTLKEFLDYVRKNPAKVNYASPGNGSPHHLAMEMFKDRTGTFITHIPYRGAAPAMQDVMSGQVQCMFLDLPAGLSMISGGKVRALAIGSSERAALLPDLPTLAQSGVKNSEVYAFQGMLGPAGIPQDVVNKLNGAINTALKDPTVVKRMHEYGMEALPGTPRQFYEMARAEAKRWGPVIKATGVKLD